MSEEARDEIFRRVRAAGATGVGTVNVPRKYRGAQGAGSDVLFMERLGDYRAHVEKVAPDEIAIVLGARLERNGLRRIVVPEGVPKEWLTYVNANVANDHPELSTLELDEIEGVVTTCTVAIAETGTIVLTHGRSQGRRALTLVPDFLLVIVEERQIVSGVPDAIALLDGSRPMTWISGPSATSDIELRRVEGVHGPRRLEVLVVSEK